jgi:chorismate mutase
MSRDLDNWRKEIDNIDDQVINLLAKRLTIIKKIGKYKKENQLPPLDNKRWTQLLDALTAKGEQLQLDPSFIKNLYNTIHEYTLSVQKKLT